MPGLRIRRPDTGAVILEITDRITRLVGTIALPVSGSLVVDGSAEGDVWFFYNFGPTYSTNQDTSVTLSGRTISWSNIPAGSTLTYGVY